ncbi:MAG: VOC family protein [Balneolaceae bacterium]
MAEKNYRVPDQTSIGHVHLKVADLERSLHFYCHLLGFKLMTTYGDQAAFISAGGYHHHIGLNTWHSEGAPPAPVRSAGLFHTAILYPARRDLAEITKRLMDNNIPITGASDHGVSEAIYLNDPDRNGLELYRDRPWKTDNLIHFSHEKTDQARPVSDDHALVDVHRYGG